MAEQEQSGFDAVWENIKQMWQEHQWLYVVAGFILGMMVWPLISRLNAGAMSFLSDLVPEAVGITFTVIVIDRLSSRRQKQAEDRAERARLIRDLGSRVNGVAIKAAEEMRLNGMLTDGSLVGVRLQSANLEGGDLDDANLIDVDLRYANLDGATLRDVNMQGATLYGASLEGSIIMGGDFSGANLEATNLKNADLLLVRLCGSRLCCADLEAANLSNADLRGTVLMLANFATPFFGGAVFDTTTVLPDAEQDPDTGVYTSYWTPETDMMRFVNRDHPDYWTPYAELLDTLEEGSDD